VAYWEVSAHEPTAVNGRWVQTPAEDFFSELRHRFVCLPVIAEDLGVITADVRETMQRFGFPGMRVLLFGFSKTRPPTTPYNIPKTAWSSPELTTTTRSGLVRTEASALKSVGWN
jgi:4-alpha-glucanotransferase